MAEEEGAASYSLWLCPAPESAVARRIQTEIDFWLAPGQGVPFAPHVTLLGGLSCREADAVANAKALSAQLRRLYVQFADVEAGDSFHQCVYVRCNQERYLMESAARARSLFGAPAPAGTYRPHCSLLYSDIAPDQRQKVAKGATDRLYGDMKGYGTLLVETGFWAETLQVWATPAADKSLQTWKMVASYPLTLEKAAA